jgi:hypothetical protein
MFQKLSIPEADVYYLLSNDRRRETLSVLWDVADEMTLRELSEQIASIEANTTPAPRLLRESVYNTLHQTHLPKLATYGLVEYDADRKIVRSRPESRSLSRYMDTLTPAGVTWGEYYRALGIGGLFAVVASLTSLPLFAAVDPLVFASTALALFALSTVYQLAGSLSRSVRSVLSALTQYLP